MTNTKWKGKVTQLEAVLKDNGCCQSPHVGFYLVIGNVFMCRALRKIYWKCCSELFRKIYTFFSPVLAVGKWRAELKQQGLEGSGLCLFNDQFRWFHAQFNHNKPIHQTGPDQVLCSDRWFQESQVASQQ